MALEGEPPNADRHDHAPWLTPGVRGIGAASLLSDAGHEIPTALLPSFLTSTLGAPASALGLIEGISDGLAGAAKLGGGRSQTTLIAAARQQSAAMPARRSSQP